MRWHAAGARARAQRMATTRPSARACSRSAAVSRSRSAEAGMPPPAERNVELRAALWTRAVWGGLGVPTLPAVHGRLPGRGPREGAECGGGVLLAVDSEVPPCVGGCGARRHSTTHRAAAASCSCSPEIFVKLTRVMRIPT